MSVSAAMVMKTSYVVLTYDQTQWYLNEPLQRGWMVEKVNELERLKSIITFLG